MPRKKAVVPKVQAHFWIPLELKAALDLKLCSELEGRVPLGKQSEHIIRLIKQDLEWETLELMAFGFPQGYFVQGPPAFITALRAHLTELHRTVASERSLAKTNLFVGKAPDAVA